MAGTNKSLVTEDPNRAMIVHDYGEDEGRGFENQTKADIQLSFMALLQGLSPAVERLDGAKAGMWMNTVSERLYKADEGFLFVPSTTSHKFAEWVPRDKGGGFRGHHEPDSEIVKKAIKDASAFGKYRTPEGNQLTETFYVSGVLCDEEGHAEAMTMVPFWSTKIRAYRGWNTRLSQHRLPGPGGRSVKPPLYANLTRILSVKAKNKDGEFFVPKITSADPRGLRASLLAPDDERFLLAKQCAQMVDSGEAKADYGQSMGGDAPDSDSGDDGDKTGW